MLAIFITCLHAAASSAAWAHPDRYSELTLRLKNLKSAPYTRLIKIGRSVEGRPIFAVILTNPGGVTPTDRRVRTLLMCGQHGDEPASVESMFSFVQEMSQTRNPYHQTLLKKAIIMWVPVVNPDGYSRSKRLNGNGADLNRNWAHPDQPETLAVSRLAADFQPHVIVDEHEWTSTLPHMPNCVEVSSYGPRSTIQLSRLLAQTASTNMPVDGLFLKRIDSQPDRDLSLAHRHFAALGICSMLLETSPHTSVQERHRAYRDFVIALLGTLTFPPVGAISDDLHTALRSRGNSQFAVASLYAGTDTSCFLYWFAAAAIGLCLLLRCAGTGTTNLECVRPPSAKRREDRGRRLTVADAVRLDSPTRVKLRLLKAHRPRPTDRRSGILQPDGLQRDDSIAALNGVGSMPNISLSAS